MAALDAELTIRCLKSERQVWHKFAAERGITLSELVRTMCNNVSGVNDPPHLDVFNGDDLEKFTTMTSGEVKRRRRRRTGLTEMTLSLLTAA